MRDYLNKVLNQFSTGMHRVFALPSGLAGACLVGCLSVSPLAGAVNYYDQAFFDSQLPIGCTADPDVDFGSSKLPPPPYPPRGSAIGRVQQRDARNQITCREQVPEAIWPNPQVKRPEWPKPPMEARPQDFDLKNAKPDQDDKVVTEYFLHLCKSGAGEFVYRKVEDEQPVSLINLRPRPSYEDNNKVYDMFWIQAINSYVEDRSVASEKYEGGIRQFGVVDWGRTQDPKTGAFKPWHVIDEVGPEGRVISRHYLAKDGTKFSVEEWNAFHAKRSGSSLFFERPMNAEERKKYPGYSLIRYEYAPLPEPRKLVTLVNDDEVFMIPRPVDTRPPMNCKKYDLRCEREYQDSYILQKRIVTPTNESKAQYGFMWREITHSPDDLRLGITGSEMMVVDMRSGEVIALRRNYMLRVVPRKPYRVVWNMRRAAWSMSCNEPVRRRVGTFIYISTGLTKDHGPD